MLVINEHEMRYRSCEEWEKPDQHALSDLLPTGQAEVRSHTIGNVSLVGGQEGHTGKH